MNTEVWYDNIENSIFIIERKEGGNLYAGVGLELDDYKLKNPEENGCVFLGYSCYDVYEIMFSELDLPF